MTRIHVLTGPVDSGKTTFLRDTLAGGVPGRPVRGYLSPRVLVEGRTDGYDLLDLGDASVRPFLRRRGESDWQRVGPYFLVPEALSRAGRLIRESRADALLVVDEVGPLEMSGRGVWPELAEVLKDPGRMILLVVRDGLLKTFRGRLSGMPVAVYGERDKPRLKAVLAGTGISLKVKFFATFRRLFGSGERDVALSSGLTVLDLLRLLGDSPERRRELLDGEAVRPHVVVMLNESNLPAATGTATVLADGDRVSIFPLLGGG
jgi:molybdopterin synthase sulfur carrier subunit